MYDFQEMEIICNPPTYMITLIPRPHVYMISTTVFILIRPDKSQLRQCSDSRDRGRLLRQN